MWYLAGWASDWEEGRPRSVEVGGRVLAVVKRGGCVFALGGICAHARGLLGRGWVDGEHLICPLHRWAFELATGQCVSVEGEGIPVYEVEIRGLEIWVRLPE